MSNFTKLNKVDGTWDKFVDNWKTQCEQQDEDYNSFGVATLPVLEDLAKNPHQHAGVFA